MIAAANAIAPQARTKKMVVNRILTEIEGEGGVHDNVSGDARQFSEHE